VLAATFAAIPILPPYAVALFGLVELWAVRRDLLLTALFAGLNLAPLFIADPAFYQELKGSHPYLTGLSGILLLIISWFSLLDSRISSST
jgi:hypothetical protein